jgi:iron complex transport system ATP-binding protein
MDSLGVGDLAGSQLRKMSTGQQRRCLLARALVHSPRTLILDEPTAGLDLAASFDYLARIRQLTREGRNIVLVTHLINEIPAEVERVILIREGEIVADGAKASVLTEENLRRTYGVDLRVAKVDDYYIAYPAGS